MMRFGILVWNFMIPTLSYHISIQFIENARLEKHQLVHTLPTGHYTSFAVRAGRLWNVLPKVVNTQTTSFKAFLGNFLDTLPDKPPTPGYSGENCNSMIDWCSQGGDS